MSKELMEYIDKLEDQAQKTALLGLVQPVVKELGVRGQDLIKLKEDLKKAQTNTPDASYAELWKQLSDSNISPKEIPKLLEKLRVTKTADDELEILKAKMKEDSQALAETQKQLKVFQNKERLQTLLPEVKSSIKDAKEKPVTIHDMFVQRHLKDIAENLSEDPVVAKEQIKSSLVKALQEQESTAKALGYQGPVVPQIPGGANFSQPLGVTPAEMQKIMREKGPEYAFAARRMAAEPG